MGIRTTAVGLELFGVTVHWYALIILAGVVLALLAGTLREQRMGLPKETSVDLVLVGLPAAIVGARIYYVLFSLDVFRTLPWWKVFAVWEGGLAIYGGLIAALLAGLLYARARKLPFLSLCDLAAPCFAIGQCVGRWGNFVNQEAYGVEAASEWLRRFPLSVNIAGQWHLATFFYESMWCLLIAAALLLAERFGRMERRGDEFRAYLFLYGLERALVEGLRTDSLMLGGLRASQLLACALVLAVAARWAVRPTGWRAGRTGLFALALAGSAMLFFGNGWAALVLFALCAAVLPFVGVWVPRAKAQM